MSVMVAGRLAFRVEGQQWNCYYALPDTLKDAIFLGSISMRFVDDPKRKEQFMAVMRECFADAMEKDVGVRPTFSEPDGVQAPDHELTKNA